jgi:hypothetical protein
MPPRAVPNPSLWCQTYVDLEVERRTAAQPSPDRALLFQQVYTLCGDGIAAICGGNENPKARRLQAILRMRYVEGMSLEAIGREIFLTQERVRQLETKILNAARTLASVAPCRRAA